MSAQKLDEICRQQSFDDIYSKNLWKGTRSGMGSSIHITKTFRETLQQILTSYPDIKTIMDIGCGDLTYMSFFLTHCKRPVEYSGVDISETIVLANKQKFPQWEFFVHDIVTDIPTTTNAELVIVKEVFLHLTYKEILKSIKNILMIPSVKYILISAHSVSTPNKALRTRKAGRLLNLSLPPFSLPKPLIRVNWYKNNEMCLYKKEQLERFS